MTPLPQPRSALLLDLHGGAPEPVAIVGMGFADFLVVRVDGTCEVAPFAEVQVVDPGIRGVAEAARAEIAADRMAEFVAVPA